MNIELANHPHSLNDMTDVTNLNDATQQNEEHPQFVHLRMHSEYSIVDGLVRLDDVIKSAAKDQQAALALTDLGNLFGLVKFYKAARSKGIKPILGCDVWISNDQDAEKPTRLLLLVLVVHSIVQVHSFLKHGLWFVILQTSSLFSYFSMLRFK